MIRSLIYGLVTGLIVALIVVCIWLSQPSEVTVSGADPLTLTVTVDGPAHVTLKP
jgi:hypothetical protein